jgi:hypothetical protein
MKLAFVIVVPVFLWLATLLSQPSVSAGTAEPKQRISVDEIGRSILLVGRLGEPLGEKMELSGYWHFPKTPHPKDDSIRFSVTSVNGNKLKEPIEFNHEQVEVTDFLHRSLIPDFKDHRQLENQVWTLIAYETGRIQIMPDEYQSKSPVFPVAGMSYYTRPFTSQIVAVLKNRQSP